MQFWTIDLHPHQRLEACRSVPQHAAACRSVQQRATAQLKFLGDRWCLAGPEMIPPSPSQRPESTVGKQTPTYVTSKYTQQSFLVFFQYRMFKRQRHRLSFLPQWHGSF